MKKINVDKIFVGLSLTYLILPIYIFLFGWLKAVYAFIFSLFFIYLAYRLLNSFSDEVFLFKKKDIIYWFLVIIILFIWVYYSGIGGFAYQNDDFGFFYSFFLVLFPQTLISLLKGLPRAVGPSLFDSLLNARTTMTRM